MTSFEGVRISEGSFFSVKRRALNLLQAAELDSNLLCAASFRTLRRTHWVEFKTREGLRVAISLSGLGTLRLFCSFFETKNIMSETENMNSA